MKIRVLSDLHLEFGVNVNIAALPEDSETVLVLAGDIGKPEDVQWLVEQLKDKFLGIVYVAGNHEYYSTFLSVEDINFELQSYFNDLRTEYKNCYFLEKEICFIEGQAFVGATLWSNFKDIDNIPYHWLSDFRLIHYQAEGGEVKRITPEVTALWNAQATKYIETTLYKYPEAVVVTHFTPSSRSITPKFAGDILNPYFHNDLDYLLEEYKLLWIHGHTHDSLDYQHGKSRVVCNPKGYDDENSNFWNEKRIEI